MSKHFFCVFSLAILFVSTNLLPMHNHRLSKNYVYSRNAKKNDLKYKTSLLCSPSLTPHFKQQSIALQNNSVNQYSLIFNHNQQPCITHYLIDGKHVAKLMQIGNEINFESDNSRTCNFSAQIPYQAGSLTINTQGRFIFEKKIDAYSACLTSKTIDFSDAFLTSNGLIVEADDCKSHAQLTCSDFLFTGKKFEIMPKSSLNTHNSLTLTAQSLLLNQGVIDSKKESLIKSLLFYNVGTLTSHNMDFEGNKIINQGTLTIADTFHCASRIFEHSGILDVLHDCIMEKGDIFFSTPSSVWNINGDWKALIASFYLQGSFSVKNLYLVGRKFTSESPMHCIAENASLKIEDDMTNAGVIKVLGLLDVDSKNVNLKKTSCIMADNADLKVNQAIQNKGTFSVKKHLSAHTRSISNKGKIETTSSDIKADRYYYNSILSVLSAKNSLTINTPLSLNLFGLAHAQQLMINSGIGLNALGIYAAKNMNVNAILSLNAGFLLPKFSTFAEMISWQNLKGLGESLFIKHVPICGVIYATLKNIQGIYHQGKTFCGEVRSFYGQKNRAASDAIALMCSTKNMFSSAKQTFSLGKQSYNSLSDSLQTPNSQPNEVSSDDITTKAKDIAQHATSAIVSHYGPSVNTTSVIDLNYGAAVGVNNHSSSLYNHNANTSLYVQNTIDTRYGKNTGYLGAYNLNINATSSYDSDNGIKVSNGSIETDYLTINAPINAFNDIKLQGKSSACIKGDVTAQKIAIKSDKRLDLHSHLNSANTHVRAKVIVQYGVITGQQLMMTGDCIINNGTLDSPEIIINRAHLPSMYWLLGRRDEPHFHNRGSILAPNFLSVDAGDIHLYEKSQISSPNVYCKSNGEWYNTGKMDTQQLVVDAQRNITNSGSVQAYKMFITQAKLDNNCWGASGRAFYNNGSLQLSEQLSVDAQNVRLGKQSQISTPSAYLKSNGEWQNNGNMDAEIITLDAQKDMTNSGFIKAQKLIVNHSGPDCNGWRKKHYHFLDQGNLQVSQQLFVDAKAIHLSEQSQIDAKNTCLKSNSNVQMDGKLKTEQCAVEAGGNVISNGITDASQSFHAKGQNVLMQNQSNVKAKNTYYKAEKNVVLNGVTNVENALADAGGNVISNGTTDASQSFHAKGQNILFQKQSNVKAKNALYEAKKNVTIDGVTNIEKGTVDAGGKVTVIGKIGASGKVDITAKDITIKRKADLSAHHADLKATETINNRGKLSTFDLSAHAKYVENSGKITAGNNAHIRADRLFWNQCLGSINVENNLRIDALVSLNSLGYIGANSILTHAIVDLNILGIYQGHDVCQHSIFGWNAGIVAPKFKSSNYLQELATLKNFGRLCEMAGMQYLPQWAPAYSLLKSAVCCFIPQEREASLYGRICTVKKKIENLSEKKDLCVTDIVPVLCEAKSTLTSVIQTGSQACGLALDSYNTWHNGTEKFAPDKVSQLIYVGGKQACQIAKDSWDNKFNTTKNYTSASIASLAGSQISNAVSLFGPQLSRDSLFDANSGLMLGINGNSQSLYNINSGTSLFANNYSLSTISGSNTGLIGGGNVSINASQSYVSDGFLAAANVSMVANDLEVTGNTYALNNILLKAHCNAKIDREIEAHQITIHAKNAYINEGASIVSQDKTNVIATETVINKGTIDGKQTTVQGRKVILEDGSTVSAHGSDSSAVIKATQVFAMHEGAEIYSEGKANVRSDGYAKIDGAITGKEISVQANRLDIQENAYISSASQTQVIAEQKLTNKGTIEGNQITVQGSEVILDNGSKVLTHGSNGTAVINATTLDLKDNSHIDSNTAFITAQSIHGEKENTINSSNATVIKTNQIDNSGTSTGLTILDFKGEESQLKSIGSVDQVTYSGTLDNNLADRLVNGHNELLNVSKGGAVVICADQKDVHLKEQHNLSHTLCMQTEGSIKCDKDLFSEKSTLLQAKGDIQHACVRSKELTALMGKNISSEGHIIHESSGGNYKDKCEESNVSGNQVIIQAQENVNYKGTHVHSGTGGTQAFIGGRLIADALKLEEYSKTENVEPGRFRWSKPTTTTVEDHITTSVPSTFSSEGVTHIVAGNAAELHDTIFASEGGTIIQGHIEQVSTYDTHEQIKEIKQADKILERTESISRKENSIRFNDGKSPVIISDHDVSLSLECNTPSITINAPTVELLVAKEETLKVCQKDVTYLGLWNRGPHEKTHDTKYNPSYNGTINTTAESIHIEDAKNCIATINAMHENASITRSLMEDIHKHQKQTLYSRPTKLGMGIAALSISIAMQALGPVVGTGIAKLGMESAVLSAVTTQASLGGMNALCQEAAHTFLNCNGNFHEAAKKLASKQTVRNIALAALTGGATAGANQLIDKVIPPLSQAKTFKDRCLSAAPHKLINGGIRCAGDIAQGKKPKEAAKHRGRETAANILGAVCSSQIGQAYGDKKICPLTHKFLHTGLGAVEGAIVDGKNGAIAGAIGAGVAETVADIASPKPPSLDDIYKLEATLGRRLTQDEFTHEWSKQIVQYLKQSHSVGDASKMIAATVALLANQDLNIASETAAKAVDNNYIILATYAITGLSVTYSGYLISNAYQEEGFEGACKQLGIELVQNAVGFAGAQVTQKVLFKVGGIIYPSAKQAVNAALNRAPGLKTILGNVSESLIAAGEKFAATGFSKQVQQLETKIVAAENKVIDTVIKNIKSSPERLVEQVVPGSVISQAEKLLAEKAAKEGAKQLALPAPKKALSLPKPVASKVAKETASVLNQDVSLSMQEIAEKNNRQNVLNAKIEELFKTVNQEKVGQLITVETPYLKRIKIESFTEDFYNKIRTTTSDIEAISKNTNIPVDIIQRIKSHVFLEEHVFLKYGSRIGKFDIDVDIAAAWQRLIDNKYVKSDLILLQHEYAEAFKMNGMEIPYEDAHDLVNTLYDWFNSL